MVARAALSTPFLLLALQMLRPDCTETLALRLQKARTQGWVDKLTAKFCVFLRLFSQQLQQIPNDNRKELEDKIPKMRMGEAVEISAEQIRFL